MFVFSILTSKLNDGFQGMFIKYEDPTELRETVTTLQNRFKFQNLSGQVTAAVWEIELQLSLINTDYCS